MRGAPVTAAMLPSRPCADSAAPASPPDLCNAAVFDQHRHVGSAAGQRAEPFAGGSVLLDVVLDKSDTVPEQVLAKFGSVRTTTCAEQFDGVRVLGHQAPRCKCRPASVI